MIQSARSGKQNILEGSKAAQTSKEMEIKLTNVGRASLEELLADYRDYLRVRDHVIWDKDSKEAQFVRRLGRKTPHTFELYRQIFDTRPPEVIANIALCLIHQTNYLLDRQLIRLEKEFVEQGGLRERMTRVRLAHRHNAPGKQIPSFPLFPSYFAPVTGYPFHTYSKASGRSCCFMEPSQCPALVTKENW